MQRIVEPEWLDDLPVEDPRAKASRGDLRRLNAIMDHAGHLASALKHIPKPQRLIDIGAGDGSLTLRLVQKLGWSTLDVVLIDRAASVPKSVVDGFAGAGVALTIERSDVYEALAAPQGSGVIVTNLFLHHFTAPDLQRLLSAIARNCQTFLACEPRRGPFPLLASKLIGLIGCNDVTRHDAPVSVRAGFANQELSALWPKAPRWKLVERSAGLFSHLFMAQIQ